MELDPDVHHTQVLKLIHAKAWGALMAADQLRFCQANGESFAGFVEGPYRFSPTFKVERRPGTHHKKKRRDDRTHLPAPGHCGDVVQRLIPFEFGTLRRKERCDATGQISIS